ncbi:MAG: hypothetical protein ACE5F8_07340 [Woeseiaceae bacterium]
MQLLETTYGGNPSVNRDAKVIGGVKILGRASRNGRTYSQAAMESLVDKYNAIQVNVDHPDRTNPTVERSIADGFGVLQNIRLAEDGIYGDLHYLESHALAPVVTERAERMPSSFGLSHNAEGRTSRKSGKVVVESIEAVHSVDIVSRPATSRGLFESEEYDMTTKTIREILNETKTTHAGRQLLLEQVDAGAIPADMPVEVSSEAPAEDGIKAAFRAAVIAAFDDDSLDTAATIAKIKDILKAQEKLASKPAAPEAPAEPPPEESVAESELKTVRAENLLLRAGREATPERIEAVAAVSTATQAKLVESWDSITSNARGQQRPPSSPPLLESAEQADFPRNPKQFADALR